MNFLHQNIAIDFDMLIRAKHRFPATGTFLYQSPALLPNHQIVLLLKQW
jgi:hypothetical protein